MWTIHAPCQHVAWVKEVLSVSSSFGNDGGPFSSSQLIGRPDVYPAGGAFSKCWMPSEMFTHEFVEVRFDYPMQLRQIAVIESNHPGSIIELIGYDSANKPHVLFDREPQQIDLSSRLLQFFLPETNLITDHLRIRFNTAVVKGRIAIDAIAISDSKDPINWEQVVPKELAREFVVVSLGPPVNSPYNELNPILSPDGKEIYFSRANDPANSGAEKFEDVWTSSRDHHNEWTTPSRLSELINNAGPNFISTLVVNGDTSIFYLGNAYRRKRMVGGVSYVVKTGDQWKAPTNLKIADFQNFSKTGNFNFSDDQDVILMSIKNEESLGGNDLFVSLRTKGLNYAAPLHLGAVVNTAGEEYTPFLLSDKRTLYFASDRTDGVGGLDLYVTSRLDDSWTNWSKPENLGDALNSPQDDFNFYTNGHDALFVRGNSENTEIFSIDSLRRVTPVRYQIVTGKLMNGNQPIKGTVQIYDDQNQLLDIIATDDGGSFRIALEENHHFTLHGETEGAKAESVAIVADHRQRSDIVLKVARRVDVHLQHILFVTDSYQIDEEFDSLLLAVVHQANTDGSAVAIYAHADDTGSDEYNMKLSQKRADAVKRRLEMLGLSDNRIRTYAFGEHKPLVDNKTMTGRALNRRVELKLFDIEKGDDR